MVSDDIYFGRAQGLFRRRTLNKISEPFCQSQGIAFWGLVEYIYYMCGTVSNECRGQLVILLMSHTSYIHLDCLCWVYASPGHGS